MADDDKRANDLPRLLVVSNRLPVRLTSGSSRGWDVQMSAGGLVTALTPALKRRGGVWVGWPGTTSTRVDSLRASLDAATEDWAYRLVPVPLDRAEVRDYYRGFSNQIIWPLFHDCCNLCNYDPRFWGAYRQANLKFARTVAEIVEPDDVLWVHDYQLMHVAAELRRVGVENRIGFFLHIPFPTADIFGRLPWREDIMGALLNYDLVGLQVPRDERHFADCLERFAPPERNAAAPRAGSFPISIDYDEFATEAAGDKVRDRARRLGAENPDRQVLLGVDRLDYSKGLLEKLAGLRYALERYPELCGKITFVQYVVPSRELVSDYRSLRLRIERTVGEINGAFSEPGWIPVHYYFQNLSRDELCAHYRSADICIVTSTKDGMNLVAKEYCAAQVDEPGVLVLSEFAGCAAELGAHALLINPFDVGAVSDAIHRAYTMSRAERAQRMRGLRDYVREHDVHRWVDRYLSALTGSAGEADVDSAAASADRPGRGSGWPRVAARHAKRHGSDRAPR